MWTETRPHEAGFGSNRVSEERGEYVPAPCTHRPSKHPSGVRMRPPSGGRIWAPQGGLSRNKVAVGESAAGSPPLTGTNPHGLAHRRVRSGANEPSRLELEFDAGPRRGCRVRLPTELISGNQSEPCPLSGTGKDDWVPKENMHHSTRVWVGRVERPPGDYQGT